MHTLPVQAENRISIPAALAAVRSTGDRRRDSGKQMPAILGSDYIIILPFEEICSLFDIQISA